MEETINNIQKIDESSVEDLTTNINKDGKLDFPNVRRQVTNTKDVLKHFDKEAFELLPEMQQNRFLKLVNPLVNTILTLQDIEFDQTKPMNQQQQRFDQFFNDHMIDDPSAAEKEQWYAKSIGAIWSIIVESISLKNSILLKESGGGILEDLKAIQGDANGIITQLNSALTSAQTELAKGGVAKHSRIFDRQATIHQKSSDKWLHWGTGLVIGAIGFAILMLLIILFLARDDEVQLRLAIFSGVIVSFLSFGMVICFKNYFAEKHNQLVNAHKGNCLSSFNTFVDAADEERKAALLLQASQTIFSHQKSGFLSKEADSQSPNPIIEVVKNVASGAGANG